MHTHRTSTHNTHSYLQLFRGFVAWHLWLGCLRSALGSALGQARLGSCLGAWRPVILWKLPGRRSRKPARRGSSSAGALSNVNEKEVGVRLERSRGAWRPLVVVEGGLGRRCPFSRELRCRPRSLVVKETLAPRAESAHEVAKL